MDKFPVQLQHFVGVVKNHCRNEGTRLNIATALQFKQITLSTDYRTVVESLQ